MKKDMLTSLKRLKWPTSVKKRKTTDMCDNQTNEINKNMYL